MDSYENRKSALFNMLRASGGPLRYADVRSVMGGDGRIKRLEAEGVIEKIGAGVYAEPGRDRTWDSLAVLTCLHPEGVACLETAASYHGLTDSNPDMLFVAYPSSKRVPVHPGINVEGYRWSPRFLANGVSEFEIGNMRVSMTDRERTVVDFLRLMDRTGMVEEAMKVLRAYMDTGGTEKALLKSARELGVTERISPVLRGVVAMRRAF